MSFDETFLDELIRALRTAGLDAIIVGNAASILHGAPILTQDVDILVRGTDLNRRKLLRLARELGGTSQQLSDVMDVRRILGSVVPVDVIFDKIGGGLRFESVKSRSVRISTGTEIATVASLEDVIRSKRAAGRKKDLAVLPILEDTLAATGVILRSREKRKKRSGRRT